MNKKSAIQKINKEGILLVFPIKNKSEPNSLWKEFFPRKKMEWDWNGDADHTIAKMWVLMKSLSDCREVVYSKWYQGRATFFSRKVFTALLRFVQEEGLQDADLTRTAGLLYETLEDNSPLSTKQLKEITELRGRDNESIYNRSCKELFSRLLIVAFGEVEDGAFPSLAVGATRILYEDLWKDAQKMEFREAKKVIDKYLPGGSLFRKFLETIKGKINNVSRQTHSLAE